MHTLVCQSCNTPMTGYPGDDICSDCAYPELKHAREAAAAAVGKLHFERTGEKVTFNELARRTMGIVNPAGD